MCEGERTYVDRLDVPVEIYFLPAKATFLCRWKGKLIPRVVGASGHLRTRISHQIVYFAAGWWRRKRKEAAAGGSVR